MHAAWQVRRALINSPSVTAGGGRTAGGYPHVQQASVALQHKKGKWLMLAPRVATEARAN